MTLRIRTNAFHLFRAELLSRAMQLQPRLATRQQQEENLELAPRGTAQLPWRNNNNWTTNEEVNSKRERRQFWTSESARVPLKSRSIFASRAKSEKLVEARAVWSHRQERAGLQRQNLYLISLWSAVTTGAASQDWDGRHIGLFKEAGLRL